jgi:hypothetical protein
VRAVGRPALERAARVWGSEEGGGGGGGGEGYSPACHLEAAGARPGSLRVDGLQRRRAAPAGLKEGPAPAAACRQAGAMPVRAGRAAR